MLFYVLEKRARARVCHLVIHMLPRNISEI